MDVTLRSLRRLPSEACRRIRTLETASPPSNNTGDFSPYSVIPNRPSHMTAMGTASDSSFSGWSANNPPPARMAATPELFRSWWDGLSLCSQRFGKNRKPAARVKNHNIGQSYSTVAGAGSCNVSNLSKDLPKVKGFDICIPGSSRSAPRCKYLESKNEMKHRILRTGKRVLRPGMVLLKDYLTHREQVDIVKICQKLGVGPGGFCQPRYSSDGGATHPDVHMMCLGLNWDPERLTYEFTRSVDGCEVHALPHKFRYMIEGALRRARLFIMDQLNTYVASRGLETLPSMCPNVCIVNFHSSATAKLGLHRDCSDVSTEEKPVVIFSLGDSAQFLYGDGNDERKAENIALDSGDVVIFGGKSRHIYHCVRSFIPNSAPKKLLEETELLPGCLSLAFKEV